VTSSAASTEHRALGALLLGAVGIAFAPIYVRVSDVGPSVTAFFRLALAVPFLWLWASFQREGRRPAGWREGARLALPGVFFAADLGVWHWSIRFTSVANATLLANFAPVFVTLGGWLVFRRRFRSLFLGGLVLALAGATVLMGSSLGLSREHVVGDVLGLSTAVFYAAYILAVGRLREQFATATILAWSATAAALLLLPIGLATESRFWPLGLGGWGVLLGLALVSHVGGQGLIAYALAHLPASFSSVTLLLQPAAATLLAWLLFDEALSPRQAVGALGVFAGILVARAGSRPPRAVRSSAG